MTYKEGDKDGSVHHDQSEDGGPSIAENVSNRPGGENTDKSTTLARLEESALPFSLDSVFPRFDLDTVMLLESWKGDEVSVQEHVERFHDLERCVISDCRGCNAAQD
jgi:hypothetical protein